MYAAISITCFGVVFLAFKALRAKAATQTKELAFISLWHRHGVSIEILRAALNVSSTTPAMVADLSARKIVVVNDALCSLLGYSREELEGHNYLDFVHPEDIPATDEASDTEPLAVRGDETTEFVNRYQHKDGTWIKLAWYAGYHTTEVYGFSLARVIDD